MKRSYADFIEAQQDKEESSAPKNPNKRVKFNSPDGSGNQMVDLDAIREKMKVPFMAIHTPWPKNRYVDEEESSINSALEKPWATPTMDNAASRLSFNGIPVASQNNL